MFCVILCCLPLQDDMYSTADDMHGMRRHVSSNDVSSNSSRDSRQQQQQLQHEAARDGMYERALSRRQSAHYHAGVSNGSHDDYAGVLGAGISLSSSALVRIRHAHPLFNCQLSKNICL